MIDLEPSSQQQWLKNHPCHEQQQTDLQRNDNIQVGFEWSLVRFVPKPTLPRLGPYRSADRRKHQQPRFGDSLSSETRAAFVPPKQQERRQIDDQHIAECDEPRVLHDSTSFNWAPLRHAPRQIGREIIDRTFQVAEMPRPGHVGAQAAIDAFGALLVLDLHTVQQFF